MLRIIFEATTDKQTPVNMVQHSYFNLAGHAAGHSLDQVLYINGYSLVLSLARLFECAVQSAMVRSVKVSDTCTGKSREELCDSDLASCSPAMTYLAEQHLLQF